MNVFRNGNDSTLICRSDELLWCLAEASIVGPILRSQNSGNVSMSTFFEPEVATFRQDLRFSGRRLSTFIKIIAFNRLNSAQLGLRAQPTSQYASTATVHIANQ